MPISRRSRGHYDESRDILEKAPKETKEMCAAMGAVEGNLDKLDYALKDRFRKLVSSQISLLKYNTPYRQPVKIKVNIKHREVRKVCSPDASKIDIKETHIRAHPELKSDETVEKSHEVVHIKQNSRGRVRFEEMPSNSESGDSDDNEIDDDKLVNRRYRKVAYKEQLLTRKNPGQSSNRLAYSSPLKSQLDLSAHSADEAVEFESLIFHTNPYRSPLATSTSVSPRMTSHYNRSPFLDEMYDRSPLPARNSARSVTPTGRHIVESPELTRSYIASPVLSRNNTESPASIMNTVRRPLRTRSSLKRPSSPRNNDKGTLFYRTGIGSPSNIRYGTLTRNVNTESDMSVKNDTGYVSHPVNRRDTSSSLFPTSEVSSPLSTRAGALSPLYTDTVALSPLFTRSGGSSPLSSRRGAERIGALCPSGRTGDGDSIQRSSPVNIKLQTMVDRLGGYNQRVSPRMEIIKESLSPRKPLIERFLVPVTRQYMDDSFETTERVKSYKRIEQTSTKHNDADITRTSTKTGEQRVFTTSPKPFTYSGHLEASFQPKTDSFAEQNFNNYIAKIRALSRKECCANNMPSPCNGERKKKASVTVRTHSHGASGRPETVVHRREFEQFTSPAFGDQSARCLNVRQELQFSSPTELPAYSPIPHEQYRDVSSRSTSVNDTQRSAEVSRRIEERNIGRLSQSSEDSTFLLGSLDSMDQHPLAHSTPIPEDSIVRYLPNSSQLVRSENSSISTVDDGKKNVCTCCYKKKKKQKQMVSFDTNHQHEHKDNKIILQHEDGSFHSGKTETSKASSVDGIENWPKTRSERSNMTKRPQREMLATDNIQKHTHGSKETRATEQCGKDGHISLTKKHSMVKQHEHKGHKVGKSINELSDTGSTQGDKGAVKHLKHETVNTDLTDEIYTHGHEPKDQKTLNEIKDIAFHTRQAAEKSIKPNMTQVENLIPNEQCIKLQEKQKNEKVCQANMTLEEQQIRKQLSSCCNIAEQRREADVHQHDYGKIEHDMLEIQPKSTAGSQTEISKEYKRLPRHEQDMLEIQPKSTEGSQTEISKEYKRLPRHDQDMFEIQPKSTAGSQTEISKEYKRLPRHEQDMLEIQPKSTAGSQTEISKEYKRLPRHEQKKFEIQPKSTAGSQTEISKEYKRLPRYEQDMLEIQPKSTAGSQTEISKEYKRLPRHEQDMFDIQTKSTTGSQTEISKEFKRFPRDEQFGQTDVYTESETSKHRGNKKGTSFNIDGVNHNANVKTQEEKEMDIDALQRAYGDVQNRLHVSATATLVNAAKDALQKTVDDDFHRELWIALNDNVHRLQEDFEQFMSTYMSPKDTSATHAIVDELEYQLRNRMETLLILCDDLDKDEFREHIEQLVGRLRSACVEEGAQLRDGQFRDEVKSLLSGLTHLTENIAVCGERFLGKTDQAQWNSRIPENDLAQEFIELQTGSSFIKTANKTVKKLLLYYSGRTRQYVKDGKPRTILRRFGAFLRRNTLACVLIFGVMVGMAIAYWDAPVGRIYKFIVAGFMYVWCSIRLVHTNPPVV